MPGGDYGDHVATLRKPKRGSGRNLSARRQVVGRTCRLGDKFVTIARKQVRIGDLKRVLGLLPMVCSRTARYRARI